MDEVWNGITLSSLLHHHPFSSSLNFQDFLTTPSPSTTKDPSTTGDDHSREPFSATVFGGLTPPPATVLSLSSGFDQFHYLERSDRTRSHPQSKNDHANCGLISSFCKKKAIENDDSSNDWRHKRMIKNRESASRSRARKQAYTNELENEVARLMEENAELRRQLEKFRSESNSTQLPQTNTLQRTLTAPF